MDSRVRGSDEKAQWCACMQRPAQRRSVGVMGIAAGPPQGETRPLGGQRPAQRRSVGVMGIAAGPPQGETRPLGGQRPAQRRSVGVMF